LSRVLFSMWQEEGGGVEIDVNQHT
jgi:hypothetical protein